MSSFVPLNTRSTPADMAGIDNRSNASRDRIGYSASLFCHIVLDAVVCSHAPPLCPVQYSSRTRPVDLPPLPGHIDCAQTRPSNQDVHNSSADEEEARMLLE